MKRCSSNKYLATASLAGFIYFFVGHFMILPDVVKGFCIGLCISMYPMGLYISRNGENKLIELKRKILFRE